VAFEISLALLVILLPFMLRKRFYIFLVALLAVGQIAAQVKLVAVPSKTVIHPNETLQLQFVAEGVSKADEFIPPAFKNFEQVSNAFETNGWTWVNGSLTEYVSYTYILKPKIKGKLSIGEAAIKAKGKVVFSQVVTIQVTDAVTVNRDVTASKEEEKPDYYLLPGEDAKEKIRKNLFVKAFIDKKSCYVGEALLATFKLYTRLDSESKILKRPSFNGFSVIDLEEPEAGIFTKEVIDGKIYNCYLIRKVQLFPLQSGVLNIEPVEITNKVRLIRTSSKTGKEWMDALTNKEKNQQLNDETIVEEELVTVTPPMQVTVADLPAGKPESFNGAVGSFAISTKLIKDKFRADESGVLQIRITGSGNIPMINAPVVNWPDKAEVFEPKIKEELSKLLSPISGFKDFEIPFTAPAGAFELPPVVFSFFDVASKTYKTVQSDPISFTVQPASLRKKKLPATETKENVSFLATWKWFLVGGILSAILLIVLAIKRFKKPSASEAESTIEPVLKEPAETFLAPALYARDSSHHKQFYSLLINGMQEFFIDRFQLQYESVSSTALRQLLQEKQLVQEAAIWNSMVNRCEEVMFSPLELNISKDELLKDAEFIMKSIDQSITANATAAKS
jgi:hypothetical protein